MNLSSDPELHDNELLEAQSHIWNHMFNFINSFSLRCAVQLGIPDLIHNHGEPMPLYKLVSALSIHPSKSLCVSRLMGILVHSGFFNKQENGEEECYTLTKSSLLLLQNNPLSMTPFLLCMLDPVITQPWNDLSSWFLKNDPKLISPFEFTFGKAVFDYASNDKTLQNLFNEGMDRDSRLLSRVLMNGECKDVFDGLSSLVDVGGGIGTMAKAIAKAQPHLECTVLDLPHVVSGLEGSHNLKYVAGNMFEAIPHADAILLKWILHDWSDEECLKILKHCKEAIVGKKEGKLIIIDVVVMENSESKADHEFIETQLFYDMFMMSILTGRERTEKEWTKLFSSAGFSSYKVKFKLGLRSLIEVYP